MIEESPKTDTAQAIQEMQFAVERETLLHALTNVQKIVKPPYALLILSHVHIEAQDGVVCLSATNLETTIQMEFSAHVTQKGVFTIPAKKFQECVETFAKGLLITVQVSQLVFENLAFYRFL